MNKGPNATIRLVRRQNHAGTTVSWTTVQREKNSHAYKLSSNVQTACSTDSLNNCPKHSILRFSSFALKIYLLLKMCQHNLPCSIVLPTACFPEGPSPHFTSALFGEGGRDWRPWTWYGSHLSHVTSTIATMIFLTQRMIHNEMLLPLAHWFIWKLCLQSSLRYLGWKVKGQSWPLVVTFSHCLYWFNISSRFIKVNFVEAWQKKVRLKIKYTRDEYKAFSSWVQHNLPFPYQEYTVHMQNDGCLCNCLPM